MTVTAFRLALGASVLVLTAGAAWSDNAPVRGTQLAALGVQCAAAAEQTAISPLYGASTTARHTNVIRVRYTAVHAMPPKRTAIAVAEASCTLPVKTGSTALD